MEAHPDSGSPLEPFIPSQAVSTEGKRTRLHQTQSLFISGSGATKKRSGTPARVRAYGLMEQDGLEACKSELSISTASQNTPTANRPKAQAPATERTVITIFCRSAFALH